MTAARTPDCIVVGTIDTARVAAGVIRLAQEWRAEHPHWTAAEAHARGCATCSTSSDACPDGMRLDAAAEPERVAYERLTGQAVVR